MDAVLPLDQMTIEEKLRTMETLWADLSRNAQSFESPAWHADVLRERDQRIATAKNLRLIGKQPNVSFASACGES